jgi:hypothetical protein
MNGRIGLGWFQLSVLKMEDVRRGKENVRCALCNEEDYYVEIFLNYMETQRWKKTVL